MSESNKKHTPVLEVQYARISNEQQSVVRFDLGSEKENAAQALRHAWNNRLRILRATGSAA